MAAAAAPGGNQPPGGNGFGKKPMGRGADDEPDPFGMKTFLSPAHGRKGAAKKKETKRKRVADDDEVDEQEEEVPFADDSFLGKSGHRKKKEQKMAWDNETDRPLLLTGLSRKITYKEMKIIAAAYPQQPTAKAIQERLTKLRAEQERILAGLRKFATSAGEMEAPTIPIPDAPPENITWDGVQAFFRSNNYTPADIRALADAMERGEDDATDGETQEEPAARSTRPAGSALPLGLDEPAHATRITASRRLRAAESNAVTYPPPATGRAATNPSTTTTASTDLLAERTQQTATIEVFRQQIRDRKAREALEAEDAEIARLMQEQEKEKRDGDDHGKGEDGKGGDDGEGEEGGADGEKGENVGGE
ncbi:uncharacterized protein LTR77_007082 [Saxophila tyrrhenica]|uniref:Uncharacterized protein n=1 Tax=Saxophila tyrrhenica TaxID=1690608 RepID=A0AAV9P446_9PEZI|nr:hypothetical protein LTR77_007082 [Saxophila tyrrhenica]